jgi:hypothetical protein
MGVRDFRPELTITSTYVNSRVDSHTFTIGQPFARVDLNHMPESTLSPSQGVLDLASGHCVQWRHFMSFCVRVFNLKFYDLRLTVPLLSMQSHSRLYITTQIAECYWSEESLLSFVGFHKRYMYK